MGENKKERRMKIRGVLFVIRQLGLQIMSGIVKGIDFIHPEGFLIKGVKP
jgi:hypothetical protein